jgi:ABC-2 type transport system permease protein
MTASATALATRSATATARVSVARVFLALLARDVHVTRRELPYFLIRTSLQPLMSVVVFGYLLPHLGFARANYGAALLPGIIAISLVLSAMQAVTLPMVIDFGATKEIEDRLLAPVPIQLVAIEKVVAGILQGMIAAVVVLPLARLIMGPVLSLGRAHFGEALLVSLLGSAAFSCLGLVLGTAIDPRQIGFIFSAVLGPMMFFGCVYYPWASLARLPAMQIAVLVNPLVFVSEAMRGALTPALPHMPLGVAMAVLAGVTLALGWLGLRTFERRALS